MMKKPLNIILIVVAVLLIVLYFRCNNGPSKDKQLIEQLNTQIKDIQRERDSLAANIRNLEVKAKTYQDSIRMAEAVIRSIDTQLVTNENKLRAAKQSVKVIYRSYTDDRQKLEEMLQHPVKKEGDSLLVALEKLFN